MDPCEVLPKRRKIAFEVGETSSSAISKDDYEVFLSFRGPDTRQGLTDNLYHALIDAEIHVFRDDDELAPGDKIDEILTALNNSQICIVVLSPKFAESAWCLREVERMVGMKKDIVPIFCHVNLDDVKLKTELYANALSMHENKYGKETVQLWREALKEIATIKGRELKSTGFVEFSRKIATEILTKLKVKHMYEIQNFVQVEDEVEAALKLLDTESGGCRFLAIHGMGGIGKTTLAKVIFNQIFDSFDCSCYLENIRDEVSKGGLQKLQEQLLRSLDPSLRDAVHIVDAIGKIKNNFTRKKVLIVLDDIDHKNHIRELVGSFGCGSRIIFTSRNAELHEQGTSSDAHFYGLEKKEMDSKQALQLFSRHAFGEDSPPEDFESLSAEAISTTGGLPLALEVVGSLLHRRKAEFWKDMIDKLNEAPHQDVQGKLKISYDALDAEQQEIFLDIACFFIGDEKTNAVYMWEACKFYPNEGIEVLISMSLVKLNEKKCFWMHDQLRDLGRAIVKVNSKDDRAGSRLWMREGPKGTHAIDLLKRNVGKEKFEALELYGSFDDFLDRENFVGLEKLRYLQLISTGGIGGDFGGLIPNLLWLSVSLPFASSFNISNLCLRELVVLQLSWCIFDEAWQGWGKMLISKQLKVLTFEDCQKLISMPDLSKLVNLERLTLAGCYKLTSIRSIGGLVKLKHLSFAHCHELRVLPDSIGDLRLLISLDLKSSGIIELPSTIGRLARLESLCLRWCQALERLPDSIGNLHSLIDLDIRFSSILELPHSFGNLTSLQKFRFGGSSVTCMALDHASCSGKFCLEELHDIPKEGRWKRLAGLSKIPNLSNFISLTHLTIDNVGSKGRPMVLEGIEQLIKLKVLYMECRGVRSLSMEWGALQQLKSLTLLCMYLEFRQCQLPCSLESLVLEVKEWGQLPINLSSLKNLSKLKLSNFVIDEADSVEGLESLEDLEMKDCILKFNDFPVLKRLRNLRSNRCRSEMGASHPVDEFQIKLSNLKNLSELKLTSICEDGLDLEYSKSALFSNMRSAHNTEGHRRMLKLQIELSNLKNLSSLELRHVSIHDDGFKVKEGCESLVYLAMRGCAIFEFANNVSVLKSLTSLVIRSCSTMICLHIPPQLDRLVELKIESCNDVVDIQGIGKLKSLTKLQILDCSSLRRIGDLSELKGPVSIDIQCYNFEGIDGVDRLLSTGALSYLHIWGRKFENVEYEQDTVGGDC